MTPSDEIDSRLNRTHPIPPVDGITAAVMGFVGAFAVLEVYSMLSGDEGNDYAALVVCCLAALLAWIYVGHRWRRRSREYVRLWAEHQRDQATAAVREECPRPESAQRGTPPK
jgi:hypothetical protein